MALKLVRLYQIEHSFPLFNCYVPLMPGATHRQKDRILQHPFFYKVEFQYQPWCFKLTKVLRINHGLDHTAA